MLLLSKEVKAFFYATYSRLKKNNQLHISHKTFYIFVKNIHITTI